MKRSLLAVGVVAAMLLVASSALAAGVRLSWTTCAGDGMIQNKDFACGANAGNHDMIGSFILDADLPEVNGNELVVDLIPQGAPTVPAWWEFAAAVAVPPTPAGCRVGSLSIAAHDGTACPDWATGLASMNIAAYQTDRANGGVPPGTRRILCVNAVQEALVQNLTGGQEYGIARWRVNSLKTVGTGSCAGCATPVCISFNSANITTLGNVNNTRLVGPFAPGEQLITFQGAGADCNAVPTKNVTWGAVKSLYR